MSENVIPFNVKPKCLSRTYKQHRYTVTYRPPTKDWLWEVEVVQTTKFSDVADTQQKAFKAAERHIDRMLKMQGVG